MTFRSRLFGVVLLAVCPVAGAADEFPARKPGLWETTIETSGKVLHTTRHCIDARTDRQMQEMGMGLTSGCTKRDIRRDGARIVSDTVCKFGQSTMTSHAVTTGDFASAIRTESDTHYEPPLMGKTDSRAVVTSKWAGECPAGWKPGDMEMPGSGQRMNISDMMKAAPRQ